MLIYEKSFKICTLLQGARVAQVSTRHAQNCAPEFLILAALKLTSSEIVVFIDMSTYILTEGRNFKTSLKENYTVALNSCYMFTKK